MNLGTQQLPSSLSLKRGRGGEAWRHAPNTTEERPSSTLAQQFYQNHQLLTRSFHPHGHFLPARSRTPRSGRLLDLETWPVRIGFTGLAIESFVPAVALARAPKRTSVSEKRSNSMNVPPSSC